MCVLTDGVEWRRKDVCFVVWSLAVGMWRREGERREEGARRMREKGAGRRGKKGREGEEELAWLD